MFAHLDAVVFALCLRLCLCLQWLGFLEVIRREGPRERSFLQRSGGTGNTSQGGTSTAGGAAAGPGAQGGTDTLTTLVEGFRFVLSAHPTTLRRWYVVGLWN